MSNIFFTDFGLPYRISDSLCVWSSSISRPVWHLGHLWCKFFRQISSQYAFTKVDSHVICHLELIVKVCGFSNSYRCCVVMKRSTHFCSAVGRQVLVVNLTLLSVTAFPKDRVLHTSSWNRIEMRTTFCLIHRRAITTQWATLFAHWFHSDVWPTQRMYVLGFYVKKMRLLFSGGLNRLIFQSCLFFLARYFF